MDPQILIIAGISVVMIVLILLPAELQIFRQREGQHHLPYAKRDYYWGNKLLSHLVNFGIGLFALYLLKQEPGMFDNLMQMLYMR